MTQLQEVVKFVLARYGDAGAFLDSVERTLAEHGITKAKLARAAGIDAREVYRWLNRHRTPTLENMLLLDEALEAVVTRTAAEDQLVLDL